MGTRQPEDSVDPDRRAFLDMFGKAAVIAPPTITMLLSASMSSAAIAGSTGGSGTIGGIGDGGGGSGDGGGDTGGDGGSDPPSNHPKPLKHVRIYNHPHQPHHK